MTNLGDVIGAIISQIDLGRTQADHATLDVANEYRKDARLSDFPIPRMSLDEVTIDLKVSLAAGPVSRNVLTQESRTEILKELEEKVGKLPKSDTTLATIFKEAPDLENEWKLKADQIIKKLSGIFQADTEISPLALSRISAATIRGSVSDTLRLPMTKAGKMSASRFGRLDEEKMESFLEAQTKELIEKHLSMQPDLTKRLGVFVTAAELEKIPPEKIATMRFTLHESDRSWTQYDDEKGKKVEKLISK